MLSAERERTLLTTLCVYITRAVCFIVLENTAVDFEVMVTCFILVGYCSSDKTRCEYWSKCLALKQINQWELPT